MIGLTDVLLLHGDQKIETFLGKYIRKQNLNWKYKFVLRGALANWSWKSL